MIKNTENLIVEERGKKYLRTGQCNRCGACGCEKLKCPHFKWINGKATCLIHDKRGQFCKECSEKKSKMCNREVIIDHKGCITFPERPSLAVIKNKICGFKFTEIK